MLTGIYQIVCKTTGKRYIGSTWAKRGFENRWGQHRGELEQGKHSSIHLQRAWNKYGAEDFLFLVLDILPRDKVICHAREQMYLDTVPRETLFNCRFTASGGNGGTTKGQRKSEDHRMKISFAQQGRITTEATKAKLRDAARRQWARQKENN